jgi:predicted nucleic acid-binding protein
MIAFLRAGVRPVLRLLFRRLILRIANPGLNHGGRGEREAIQLAEEQRASLPLIDERKGQSEAARRGLSTAGTLGVLPFRFLTLR